MVDEVGHEVPLSGGGNAVLKEPWSAMMRLTRCLGG
jgi:hypothetical protein